MFRDETTKVMRKAQAKTPECITSPEEVALVGTSRKPSDGSSVVHVLPELSHILNRNPSRKIEDEASSYFFHHFVSKDSVITASLYDFLPAIYHQGIGQNDPLPDIVAATGLAGIANISRSSEVMLAARAKHTEVLRITNAALRDPERAKADSTLMAVLLLGMFEIITCPSPQSMLVWAKHVHGATTIARIRGRCQLKTELGRRLFLHLRNQIIIDCLQRRKSVPEMITDWNDVRFQCLEDDETVEPRLVQLMARISNLRHDIRAQGGEDSVTTAKAYAIDADLEAWAASVPVKFLYKTVPHHDPTFLFEFRHDYVSNWIASSWNSYRIARIFANQCIIAWLTPRSQRAPDIALALEKCKNIQNQMCDDICASVPYYLDNGPNFTRDSHIALKASAGFSVLWPLYTVATAHHATAARNAWIIRQYEKIGDQLGIHQATALANTLKQNREITIWDRDPTRRIDEREENEEW